MSTTIPVLITPEHTESVLTQFLPDASLLPEGVTLLEGSVTVPHGFQALGKHVGIKKAKKDFAVIASTTPCATAGVFTQNVVKAAPVTWCQKLLKDNAYQGIQAVVINSGNANACTGEQGEQDNLTMAQAVANELNLSVSAVMTASTGVIGVPMPMNKILTGTQNLQAELGSTPHHAQQTAEAIMTTDTGTKTMALQFQLGGQTVHLGGIAKGSGMIHPNMATMLGFLTTDADITPEVLQTALFSSIQNTFNLISVDGDTSTNDMVLVMANGQAQNPCIDSVHHPDYPQFLTALNYANQELGKAIVKDGEGASKLMTVKVTGAKSEEGARQLARSVTTSSLVKTALFGADANWGRILCALGYAGVDFNPAKVSITLASAAGSLLLYEQGTPIPFDEAYAKAVLSEREVDVLVQFSDGEHSAIAWGCDLSYDYVKINGDYRS